MTYVAGPIPFDGIGADQRQRQPAHQAMLVYDPDNAPDPQQWLSLDEQLRIGLAEKFHHVARVDLPDVKAHAAFHAIIENQIATQHPPVLRAMERLAKQGLSRHDCLHAIGWVLAKHFHELITTDSGAPRAAVQARFDAAVERLTVGGVHRSRSSSASQVKPLAALSAEAVHNGFPIRHTASKAMKTPVNRQTVDLSAFPELVVIYLGMRVNALAGIKTVLGLGPQIQKAGNRRPDGLLHFENNIIYSVFPFHVGMRWYWKDFDSMERWSRSPPHREWWQTFLKDSGGTGFWHETYFMGGGMEAIYDDVPRSVGLQVFAPAVAARGSSFSARRRALLTGAEPSQPEGNSEAELY